jgi:hypothetical protein
MLLKVAAALSALRGSLLRLIAIPSAGTAATATATTTRHAGVVTARSISALPIRIGPRLSEFAFAISTFAEIAISDFPIGHVAIRRIAIRRIAIRRIASTEISQGAFRLFRPRVKGFRT